MKLAAEKIYTVASFVLAVAALGYALYSGAEFDRRLKKQDERLEQHFRLSLQPNMAFGFYYNEEGSGWSLMNSGSGPAILKWFSVAVDGKFQSDWDAFRAALGLPDSVRYRFA